MNSDSNSFSILNGGSDLLDRIAPLWNQLREHHADLAPRWRKTLLSKTFAQRRVELIAKAGTGLLASLAISGEGEIGYCISTISTEGQGEVDSIFVVPSARNRGAGSALMAEAVQWFETNFVRIVSVDVAAGNDAAIAFYSRYGFSPRKVRLLLSTGDD